MEKYYSIKNFQTILILFFLLILSLQPFPILDIVSLIFGLIFLINYNYSQEFHSRNVGHKILVNIFIVTFSILFLIKIFLFVTSVSLFVVSFLGR